MARSVIDASFAWGINGLVRNVSGAIESQSETRKGLPNFIKVVGSNKLWSGEISGDVTAATTITLTHTDKVACNVKADGINVAGFLKSFSCSGSSNSIVEFRASVEGKSGTTGAVPTDPGEPIFLEACTISADGASAGIIDFSLDASWDLEHTYDETGVPTDDGTSFKSFDGTFVCTTSEAATDRITTTGTVDFSVVAGGLNIAGTGKVTKVEQGAEVDGVVKFKRTIKIITLGSGT